jgi:rieske iron-sulfur protein
MGGEAGRAARSRDRSPGEPSAAAPDRRSVIAALAAAGVCAGSPVMAAEPRSMRPQPGDRFVFAQGDRAGAPIAPADVAHGAAPVVAWPVDPATRTVRDGSRLNQVLLVRLDPADLDEATTPRAADGIVAYSATCTHALCPVGGWNAEAQVLHCPCHQSEFDPRREGKVVAGPAPRALPALAVKIEGDALMAAGTFSRRVGASAS